MVPLRWISIFIAAGVLASAASCSRSRKAKPDSDPNGIAGSQPSPAQSQFLQNPGYRGARRLTPTAGVSYRKVNIQEPYIAMTFDDGPHKTNTPRLLDILRARNIRATFYVLEPRVKLYPHIMQRIIAEGHEIGNHTITHRNLSKLSDQAIRHELRQTHNAIVAATGVPPQTMRPPFGALQTRQREMIRREFGYPAIFWSVDPEDWKKPGVGVVTRRLIDGAKPGGILLAHDIHASTISAVPGAVDGLLRRGFRFVTVSELINLEQQMQGPPRLASADAPPF